MRVEGIVTKCSSVRPKVSIGLCTSRVLFPIHTRRLALTAHLLTMCLPTPLAEVVMSKHWCPNTKSFTTKEYRDLTSLTGIATGSAYPTKDAEGNLLETEYGLCEYMDHQTIHLQEMPERAPPGQLPRSIEIVLEADLVDSAKPGDRLYVSGIHRALPSKSNSSGTFRTIILGNSVRAGWLALE